MYDELNKLYLEYDFKYDTIGRYIRVYSNRDTWYIINKEYKSHEKIKLYHANNYGGAGIHKQKKNFSNLSQVFNYISNHDNRELLKKDKVQRIAEKLKILY